MESKTLSPRKPAIAALLSLFGTGAGHLYAGRPKRGLILFALTLVSLPVWFFASHLGPSTPLLWVLLALVAITVLVYLYAVFDAVRCARAAPTPYAAQVGNHASLYVLLGVVALGWSVGGALLVRARSFEAFQVASASMAPTLPANARVLVNKRTDRAEDLSIGSLIVFRPPGLPKSHYIKRVAGLPGDVLTFLDGQLSRNGQPAKRADAPGTEDTEIVVPPGHVYVLGDARSASRDSRAFGPVAIGAVTGIVQYVLPGAGADAGALHE